MGSRTTEGELLQRHRRDRRELLSFLLSSSVLKKVILPPGAVSLEDLNFDHISVDHVLECCRSGVALDLAVSSKLYHEQLRAPPVGGVGTAETFYLTTNPEESGPPPERAPPPARVKDYAVPAPGESSSPLGRAPPPPARTEEVAYASSPGEHGPQPEKASQSLAHENAYILRPDDSVGYVPLETSPVNVFQSPAESFRSPPENDDGYVNPFATPEPAVNEDRSDSAAPEPAGIGASGPVEGYSNPFDEGPLEPHRPSPPPGSPPEVDLATSYPNGTGAPQSPVPAFKGAEEHARGSLGHQTGLPAAAPLSSELALELPPFATGMTEFDVRETAYEVLLASAGAAGGLASPAKESPREEKSKLLRRFSSKKGHKDSHNLSPGRALGLAGLMETMRIQLQIPDTFDRRTREALLRATTRRVGRRMDTLLVPLELLMAMPRSEFPDDKEYVRWSKRQLHVLEEGLINHPQVRLDAYNSNTALLKTLIAKFEGMERMPGLNGPAQQMEVLKVMRGVTTALAERGQQGEYSGESCHWADGYHFNIQLYQKLLLSCFNASDEGHFVEEVEEILELLKSTWRILGITQYVHDVLYTWVLFCQFVKTQSEVQLKHALGQLKRLVPVSQLTPAEKQYTRTMRALVATGDGPKELSMLQSVLTPMKDWAEQRLCNYHLYFAQGEKVRALISFVATCTRLLGGKDEDDSQATRGVPNGVTIAKRVEDYIRLSVTAAYYRAFDGVGQQAEAREMHPVSLMAVEVRTIMEREAMVFSPILAQCNILAAGIAASLLHGLYLQELKPFLEGVTVLTSEVEQVLPPADELDQYLCDIVNGLPEDEPAANQLRESMVPYEVSQVSGLLVMRWVNSQLAKMNEWVDRTIFAEKWAPISKVQRHAVSIIDVFRIIDETFEQFFGLMLPMRLNLLKGLATGVDSALQLYVNRMVAQLGPKDDLVPPVTPLARYKKDSVVKVVAKKAQSPEAPLLDDERVADIDRLTTESFCVRLNSLQFILAQLEQLEDTIRERWALKRPQDDIGLRPAAGRRRLSSESEKGLVRRGATGAADISGVFEPVRRIVNQAIDKICDFTGVKVVFWDLREPFLEGLYKGNVAAARMDQVVGLLDPVLGELCELIAEPLRDRVVLSLLQASLDGLLRVLLDGGPLRTFAPSDAEPLDEDLNVLKDFFIAEGDGLPRTVVENTAAPVQQILNLYSLETSIVVENYKHASEASPGVNSSRVRGRGPTDAETLLRVLCHRADRGASKFLKKTYKLPKA